MRRIAAMSIRMALVQLVLLASFAAVGPAGASPSDEKKLEAETKSLRPDTTSLLRHDSLAVTSRNVMRVAVHAPGQYVNEVMQVFRMRIDRFVPPALGFGRDWVRPYLLGGRAVLHVPSGRTVGAWVPGDEQAAALHVGGGAELRIRDGMFLSMDYGEVLHSGSLEDRSYQTYSLGVVFDF